MFRNVGIRAAQVNQQCCLCAFSPHIPGKTWVSAGCGAPYGCCRRLCRSAQRRRGSVWALIPRDGTRDFTAGFHFDTTIFDGACDMAGAADLQHTGDRQFAFKRPCSSASVTVALPV